MTYSIYVAVAMQEAPPVDRCELVPYQYDQAGADFALMRYKARWRRSGPGDRAIVRGMMARERAVLLEGRRRLVRSPRETRRPRLERSMRGGWRREHSYRALVSQAT